MSQAAHDPDLADPADPAGPADVADLDRRRVEAIDLSGWGAVVDLRQPRNLALWVLVGLTGYGALVFGQWLAGSGYYAPALTIAAAVFAIYAALLWWFTQLIDRYSSQPVVLRVLAFMWGGFAATWVIAAPANDALRSLYAKWFGQDFALSWGASFAAPFTEEWGKGIGLLLLIAIAPHLVRTAFDGFILGAFLGMGFQTIENVAYALNGAASRFGSDQVEASSTILWLRTSSGLGGHIAFSAVFGAGLVFFVGRPGQPRRRGLGVALVLTAMGLHFLFDGGAAISRLLAGEGAVAGLLVFGSLIGTPLLGIVVALLVFRTTVTGEQSVVGDVLAPEVARGVLTESEVEAVAGGRRARRAYRHEGSGLGHRRRNRHVLDAVFDLTHELGRSRGQDDERVQHAREEVVRLRQVTQRP